MTPETKAKIEAAGKKAEIFEPKYNGKDHSGYDTLMKYEVNDYLNESYTSGATYGYNLAIEELSKGGEFDRKWIDTLAENHDVATEEDEILVYTATDEKPQQGPLNFLARVKEYISIRALQAANARIAQLESELIEDQKQTDELVGNLINERAELIKKLTTLEARVEKILEICKGHESLMWSAKIISIILDCEFRDAEQTLESYLQNKGG